VFLGEKRINFPSIDIDKKLICNFLFYNRQNTQIKLKYDFLKTFNTIKKLCILFYNLNKHLKNSF